MTRANLNLARRPFTNTRPVVRVSALLWGLALILLATNVFLYWSFYQGQGEQRAQLTATLEAIDQERDEVEALERRLDEVDLEALNAQVAFLNRKISQRTFGWSRLFDALAEILPREVRLERLTPVSLTSERGVRRIRDWREMVGSTERVPLSVVGQAQSSEALYRFVDALFEAPAFEDPNPAREATGERGLVRFDLEVVYLPAETAARTPEPALTGSPDGDGSADGEPVAAELEERGQTS